MRPDEALIDEAAQWMALLQSGEASAGERAAFEAWRAADPRHQRIIEQMGGGLNLLRNPSLRNVPRNSLLHSLNAPSSRRRFISGSLSVLGVALLAGLLGRRYGWLPVEHVAQLTLEPVADLRDLVWAPAQLTFANGGETVALLPVRYAGTAAEADGALRMAPR